MYDLLVFIGRFQPFHNEHARIVSEALTKAQRVLVLIGSAGSPRTIKNPFTYEDREAMIHETFRDPRIVTEPLYDMPYNDIAWATQVRRIVASYEANKVGLIGASKDHSSYYLNMFPEWESENVEIEYQIHATDIREEFFLNGYDKILEDMVPPAVEEFIMGNSKTGRTGFVESAWMEYIIDAYETIEGYKESWGYAPYPVNLSTVDAVIEKSGHVLLVERQYHPGLGLYALPGGFLNVDERIEDGMIRELREETQIKLSDTILRQNIKQVKVFDDPARSNIGRVITHAHYIPLRDDMEFPKVKGADDAKRAFWMPISSIKENLMYDDHYHIIKHFTGVEG